MLGPPGCIKGGNRNWLPPRKPQKKTPKQPTMCCTRQHFFTTSPCLGDQLMPLSHLLSREVQNHPKIQISDRFGASQALPRQRQGVRLCNALGSREAICNPGGCHLLILPITPGPLSHLSHTTVHLTATREWGKWEKTPQQNIENPILGQMDN